MAVFNCTAVANSFVWRNNIIEIDEEMGTILTPVLVDEMEGIRKSTVRVSVSSTDNAANNYYLLRYQFNSTING